MRMWEENHIFQNWNTNQNLQSVLQAIRVFTWSKLNKLRSFNALNVKRSLSLTMYLVLENVPNVRATAVPNVWESMTIILSKLKVNLWTTQLKLQPSKHRNASVIVCLRRSIIQETIQIMSLQTNKKERVGPRNCCKMFTIQFLENGLAWFVSERKKTANFT